MDAYVRRIRRRGCSGRAAPCELAARKSNQSSHNRKSIIDTTTSLNKNFFFRRKPGRYCLFWSRAGTNHPTYERCQNPVRFGAFSEFLKTKTDGYACACELVGEEGMIYPKSQKNGSKVEFFFFKIDIDTNKFCIFFFCVTFELLVGVLSQVQPPHMRLRAAGGRKGV